MGIFMYLYDSLQFTLSYVHALSLSIVKFLYYWIHFGIMHMAYFVFGYKVCNPVVYGTMMYVLRVLRIFTFARSVLHYCKLVICNLILSNSTN